MKKKSFSIPRILIFQEHDLTAQVQRKHSINVEFLIFQEYDLTASENQNILHFVNVEFLIFQEHDLTAQVKKNIL